MIRVRFAPSPTGHLHVGGARTALFNWLFARHHDGVFVLRIEDTDQTRSTAASIDQIHESLNWLGLEWDEHGRQTDRATLHQTAAETLLTRGLAYEMDGAFWFRVPTTGETVVRDLLAGDVAFQNEQLKDFVIRRSDGSFVYNFAVVVDDADMEISHVIRGDDHLNNTPRQILLYEALERPLPRFAHLPMILGPDRSRLSKRHGDTSVLEYRKRGLLPETMVNFFARLGWSHGDQEIFTRRELVDLFSLDAVGSSAAVFDERKLHWLNQQHLKAADPARVVELLRPFVAAAGQIDPPQWDRTAPERLAPGIDQLRNRCETLVDLARLMPILFPVPIEREVPIPFEASAAPILAEIVRGLSDVEPFTAEAIEARIRDGLAASGGKLRDVAQTIRVAVTGRDVGPGLFEILSAIGRDIVIERLTEISGD